MPLAQTGMHRQTASLRDSTCGRRPNGKWPPGFPLSVRWRM